MTLDRTLVQIRERSSLELLDLALVVLRSRPLALGATAALGIAPFAAIYAALAADPEVLPGLLVLFLAMAAPWATAPLTVVLGGLMFGERPTAGKVARALARGLPAMVFYQVFVRGALAASVILAPLLPSRLAFLNEVILLERGKARAVVKRCSTLAGHRGGDFFGQWLAQVVFGLLFIACFWYGTGAAVSALTTSELTWDRPGWGDLYGFRMQLAVWLTVAFFGVARFLTYIDQRIRLEGWEVKLRLQSVGRALEEAGRW